MESREIRLENSRIFMNTAHKVINHFYKMESRSITGISY